MSPSETIARDVDRNLVYPSRFSIRVYRRYFIQFTAVSCDLGRGLKVPRLIDVPSSANIEIAHSFCDVAEPGVHVLCFLHVDLPWINFLDGARVVTVLLDTDGMSVEMRNHHGGVITIDVKEIPIAAYGLDDVMPPRYPPLSINMFDAASQLTSLKSISSEPFDRRPQRGAQYFPAPNGVARPNTSKIWHLWLYLSPLPYFPCR